MVAFRRLRDMIDDDPSGLEELAAGDEKLEALCFEVSMAAGPLEFAERKLRRLFAAPVDPAFLQEWRDYENRYASVLSRVQLASILRSIGGYAISSQRQDTAPPRQDGGKQFELILEQARDEGRQWESDIESVFEWARQQIDFARDNGDVDDELADTIDEGIAKWRSLADVTGFHIEAVIGRRMLVPFVLIPRHVSARHGSGEKLSLLTKLQEAQEAFVFGLPLAALALMRSVLELILDKHYGSTGNDLNERIKNARHLPANIRRDRLHGLRQLANDVLHAESEKKPELPKDLERQLIAYLVTLRDPIEQAPTPERIRRG
jgi:hypothetical protein